MDKNRTAKSDLSDAELERLFQASDAEASLPSGDFMARILADAQALQPQPSLAPAPVPPRALTQSPFAALREALGGWRGLSGLAGAVATGLVIGVFPPEALATYADGLLNGEALFSEYVPGLGEVSFDG
ncbi:MAG: hypothetical protein AAF647_00030 [Pseudomonadota bacterium]